MTTARSQDRKRRADAQRSDEAILDATLAIIKADQDLNMAAVARQADVSRVTLYSHYATKELLVEAVVRRAVTQVAPLLEKAAQDETDALDAFARLLGSSWEALAGYRNLHAVAASCLTPAALRDAHAALVEPLHRLITSGQETGVIRTDLPVEWLIATIFNLMHLASEQVESGQMRPEAAGSVATSTVLSVLSDPTHSPGRQRRRKPTSP
ncbi:MAG: TetR/AcrR family transcriptional regulator [Nocardioidaceae bacterium]